MFESFLTARMGLILPEIQRRAARAIGRNEDEPFSPHDRRPHERRPAWREMGGSLTPRAMKTREGLIVIYNDVT